MTDHPAVAYLRNAHQHAEQLARRAEQESGLDWVDSGEDSNLPIAIGPWAGPVSDGARAFIASNDPAAVLRRVEAERAAVEACQNVLDGWTYGETRELAHDVIEQLARGWGWTEEAADV